MKALLLSFIFIFFLLTELRGQSTYKGDYPVHNIRSMWQICYAKSLSNNINLPPMAHVLFCDCMVDTVRSKWTYNEMENPNINSDVLNKRMAGVAGKCLINLGFKKDPNAIKKPPVEKSPEKLQDYT